MGILDNIVFHCSRCNGSTPVEDKEYCWYCLDYLCGPCWEAFGHCGHPEADEANRVCREKAREENSPAPRPKKLQLGKLGTKPDPTQG